MIRVDDVAALEVLLNVDIASTGQPPSTSPLPESRLSKYSSRATTTRLT